MERSVPAACAVLAFLLYLNTAAPSITWAHGGTDGAELSAVAYTLGIAHPTGYPFYTLIAHLFTRLPVGEVAFRVTLLSALAAAVGVGLVAWTAGKLATGEERNAARLPLLAEEAVGQAQPRPSAATFRWPGPAIAAGGAGVTLATAPLYWSQAVIPEVYALHAAFVVGLLALYVQWHPEQDGHLCLFALVLGLAVTHHATALWIGGPLAVAILLRDRGLLRRRAGVLAAVAFALGLLPLFYLPLRAVSDPPLNWGDPSTLPRFLTHITAREYQAYLGAHSAEELLGRLPVVARLLLEQATWPGLVVGLLGWLVLAPRRPWLGIPIAGGAAVSLGFALLYRARDGEAYLLPMTILLALGVGLGLAHLARALGSLRVAITIPTLLVLQLWLHGPSIDIRGDQEAVTFARSTLLAAAPGATINTTADEHTFALWYVQLVEGFRTDVQIVDSRLLRHDWYREQLARRRSERP